MTVTKMMMMMKKKKKKGKKSCATRKEKGERERKEIQGELGKYNACIMLFSRSEKRSARIGGKKTRGRGEKRGEKGRRREVACDTGNGFTWRDGSIHVARSVREGRRGERG